MNNKPATQREIEALADYYSSVSRGRCSRDSGEATYYASFRLAQEVGSEERAEYLLSLPIPPHTETILDDDLAFEYQDY